MNSYNNPYKWFQNENPPRNQNYNQNNQQYFQKNSYNIHKRSKYQWSSKNQGSQNSHPNNLAASTGPQCVHNSNPPPPVQNSFPSVGKKYDHSEVIPLEPQVKSINRGIKNAFGETQKETVPKRVQNVIMQQFFVPSLLDDETTVEATSGTKDEVVKVPPQASFAVANTNSLTKPTCYNSRQIKLLEAFSKPVESTKAERMMQKMGWKGGALGSSGQGLTEPLMPNIFQQNGAGFGVPEPEEEREIQTILTQPAVPDSAQQLKDFLELFQVSIPEIKQQRKVQNIPKTKQVIQFKTRGPNTFTNGIKHKYVKMRNQNLKQQELMREQRKRCRNADEDFKVDVLNQILNFVKYECKTKMAFSDLTKFQRKTVHDLVDNIRGKNNKDGTYDNLYTVDRRREDLIKEIMEIGRSRELVTYDSSVKLDTDIHLYKGVPKHVFLITEHDLRISDYVDDCIVTHGDVGAVEETKDKANEDHNVEPYNRNIGEHLKTDILNLQSRQNINNGKILPETNSAYIEYEEAIKNDSSKTDSSYNVKTDIFNDVQSISKGDKETSTQSAKVKDEETIKKPNEKFENRNTEPTSIKSENITDISNGVQSQQSIGSDNLEKPKSIKRVHSNVITTIVVNQNISAGKQESNIKVIEDTAQNEEIVKTKKEQIRETLIEFFKKFIYNEMYTEIRFSGDFNKLETDEIDTFMTDVELCIGNVNNCQYVWNVQDNLKDIFQNKSYSLVLKVTLKSDILIQKVPKVFQMKRRRT